VFLVGKPCDLLPFSEEKYVIGSWFGYQRHAGDPGDPELAASELCWLPLSSPVLLLPLTAKALKIQQ